MAQDNVSGGSSGSGNKVFLFIILVLCILIVVLLLLMMAGVIPLGGAVVCKAGYGTGPTTGTSGGGTYIINRYQNQTGGNGPGGSSSTCYCDQCIPRPCPSCNKTCNNNTKPCVTDCGTWPSCGGSCTTANGALGTCAQGDNKCCVCNPSTTRNNCVPLSASLKNADTDSVLSNFISFCTNYGGTVRIGFGSDDVAGCVFHASGNSDSLSCSKLEANPAVPDFKGLCEKAGGQYSCSEGQRGETIIMCACPSITLQPTCENSFLQQCGGTCPSGQICEEYHSTETVSNLPTLNNAALTSVLANNANLVTANNLPNACRCVPRTQDCGQTTYPTCGGTCPSGQQCNPVTVVAAAGQSYCTCQPVTQNCGQSSYPTCGGTCPSGQTCTGVESLTAAGQGHCQCTNPNARCSNNQYPACGGLCDTGYVCKVTAGAATCSCQPVTQECGQSTYPTCGGTCPSGQECMSQTPATGGPGYCQCLSRCNNDQYPTCGGMCATGYHCAGDVDTAGCSCQSNSQYTCSSMGSTTCSRGTCPSGQTCTYGNGGCGCQPNLPDCGTLSANSCSRGYCPSGQTCIATVTGGCSCQTPCADISSPGQKTCGAGYCPPEAATGAQQICWFDGKNCGCTTVPG